MTSWPESTAKAGRAGACAPLAADRELLRDERVRGRDRLARRLADARTEDRVATVPSYSAAALHASRSDDPGARLSHAGARAWRACPCGEAKTAQPRCRDRNEGCAGLRSRRCAQTRRPA